MREHACLGGDVLHLVRREEARYEQALGELLGKPVTFHEYRHATERGDPRSGCATKYPEPRGVG